MDAIEKDLLSRKDEIKKAIELLFTTNLKITDWDVPEADDQKASEVLLKIFQESLAEIEQDVIAGKYKNY